MASSFIDCALEDRRGKLWLSTTKGISSFDPTSKTFRNFSTAEGLPGTEMTGTGGCLRAESGRMYFAGLSGATTFIPEDIPEKSTPPPTVITDFRVLGSSHSPREKVTSQAISYASGIKLTYKQTPFSLSFAALSYSDSPANRYRYKLESLDSAWTEVGSESRTVTYNGLPAGKYRFRVQGATNSSGWSEPGAELEIVILPAWWKTWWFRTIYVSVAFLAVWLAYSYRMREIAKQSNIRTLAQLNERMRIARELHDTLLQRFQAATLRFEVARRSFLRNADDAMQVLDEAIYAAEEGITEGRAAIRDLRPKTADQRSLPELMDVAGHELVDTHKLNEHAPSYQVIVEGKQMELSPLLQDEVYRIAHESIRNAFMHAGASRIEVEIRYDRDQFRLRVRDDGTGIDAKILKAGGISGHFGILGMTERAQRIGAQLDFWSQEGAGTEVQIAVSASVAYQERQEHRRFRFFRKAEQ